MKLSILHETTLVGAIAVKSSVLGPPRSNHDITRPRGEPRWYLSFAEDDYVDGLMEKKDASNSKATKVQFGSQTSRPKKLVWQPEESQGRELTNKSLYVPPGTVSAEPYGWPRETFHGQSKDYTKHILKPRRRYISKRHT